jgi:hypothetical protein
MWDYQYVQRVTLTRKEEDGTLISLVVYIDECLYFS